MPLLKIAALIVWFVICVVLGARGSVKLNDHPVHPLLAPIAVIITGAWFAVVAAVMLAPWIWLIWP